MEKPGFDKITIAQAPDGRPTGYPTLEAPGLVEKWRDRKKLPPDTNVWQVLAAGVRTLDT